MIRKNTLYVKAINLTVDYVVLNLSMIIAYFIVDKSYILWISNKNYFPSVLIFNLLWLLCANITGLYEHVLNKDSVRTYRIVIKSYFVFVSLICFIILIFIGTKAYFITREYLIFTLALFGFLLCSWKLVFLSIRFRDRGILRDSRNAIIVGGGYIGDDLYNFIEHTPDQGYKILGFFEDEPENVRNKSLYLGKLSESIDYVTANNISEIFCTLPNSKADVIKNLMREANKKSIHFSFIPEYYIQLKKPTYVQSFGHIPVISVRPEPLENVLNRFFKRLFDILFSLTIIILVFSWLFPILAILIKLSSEGPVFFVQPRSGRGSKPFKCFKFRSMRVHDDKVFVQATKNDSRVTKIGAIMRKTSLDEMPQFFNVLIGNMSVVGPRPHPIKLDKEYMDLINLYRVRHFVKPGITGWAQVIGLRGETPDTKAMLKRIEADVWYLENWSFLLDIKIVYLTFLNAIKGDENAF